MNILYKREGRRSPVRIRRPKNTVVSAHPKLQHAWDLDKLFRRTAPWQSIRLK
jgi:hypothetical protein